MRRGIIINFKTTKPIIAVTGSAGKTTVKAMVSAILRERWIIYESSDYHNTTENTPQHKTKIGPIHRAAVLEYGMGFAGQISEHCSIIQPDIAIVTNVGSAHIGNFDGKLEKLAAAKSEIIKGMKQEGVLFLNRDDKNSSMLDTSAFTGEMITVGIETSGDYRARNIHYGKNGMEFTVKISGSDYLFAIPIYGFHNIYNALFAIAIADLLGFPPEDMQNGLSSIIRPEHRLHLLRLRDGITVIDDTVHAHPPAMKAAIDVLLQIGAKKRIAVLGSMSELGERMEDDHLDIGKYVATRAVDELFTYGNFSRLITEGALLSGMAKDKANHYTGLYRKKLHQDLLAAIEPGTTILVKGSSKQNLFETVEYLQNYYN